MYYNFRDWGHVNSMFRRLPERGDIESIAKNPTLISEWVEVEPTIRINLKF